jgi:hypothetical protein
LSRITAAMAARPASPARKTPRQDVHTIGLCDHLHRMPLPPSCGRPHPEAALDNPVLIDADPKQA